MLRPTRHGRHDAAAPTRRTGLRATRRARTRRRATLALAVLAVVASTAPTAATARDVGSDVAGAGSAVAVASAAVAVASTAPLPPPGRGPIGTQATVEDAEAWCDYLSSYYLAFPSPWSARVINCRSSNLFVAPLYSDGSLGMCVLVPARHSRHLGGNVARWVTDIRLC